MAHKRLSREVFENKCRLQQKMRKKRVQREQRTWCRYGQCIQKRLLRQCIIPQSKGECAVGAGL